MFYSKVFGWGLDVRGDTDEFRYSAGTVDGIAVAGVMDGSLFLPAEVPAHWQVYFGVADVDAAPAKAVELGGTVIDGPDATPFGRLAIAG